MLVDSNIPWKFLLLLMYSFVYKTKYFVRVFVPTHFPFHHCNHTLFASLCKSIRNWRIATFMQLGKLRECAKKNLLALPLFCHPPVSSPDLVFEQSLSRALNT